MNESLDIILDSVRKVEWRALKDRLGFIDYNIADILNNLIDDDLHKRNIAYWKLDNHIVIQGGLSESCFYILPFLNELLTITNNRLELLNIIFEIFNGNDRYLAGIGEVALKAHISDKTNWRKMLTNTLQVVDLNTIKQGLKAFLPQETLSYFSEEVPIYHINYPVLRYPTKVTSLTMPKTLQYQGRLMGIKGQYLLFEDNTVFNVRGHEGFVVEISF